MAFIDDMRSQGHAVESTCRVLTEHGCRVAARTYRSWKQTGRPVATRTASDAVLMDVLIAVQGTPEGLYGRRKMTRWLRRQGHQVAFCTTDRLMRDLGMNGVRRVLGRARPANHSPSRSQLIPTATSRCPRCVRANPT